MQKPEKLLYGVSIYNKLLSFNYKKIYFGTFFEDELDKRKEELWNKRKYNIERVDRKIENAVSKTQQVTPSFLGKLIGLYERKNTNQKEKMYIILELQKYYSLKIMQFFYKLNDIELNKQLRWIAFYHLQSFNYQPRARRQKYMRVHTKSQNRKKYLKNIYPNEKYIIPKTPNELEYRIENGKEQKIKEFDYFVSHSSKDSEAVQKLIAFENSNGKNVFCDWINDVDYLKRHLLCDATLKVLEKRLDQSKAIILVLSENSLDSIWCKYELNYYLDFKRPMYFVEKSEIETGHFDKNLLENKWFIDPDYKNLALLEGAGIQL